MILREVIVDALRLIGVIEVGQTASADEDAETLRTVNAMLNSWRTERLMAYAIVSTNYTVSGSGTIAIPRPVRIEGLWLADGDGNLEVESLTNQRRYMGGIYNDGAYPTSTLTLNPAPAAGTVIRVETWVVLASFAALTDTVSIPDGYLECIQYNLALRLAPRYKDAMVSDLVRQEARDAKANVKRMNYQPQVLRLDPALLGPGGGWTSGGGLFGGTGGGGGGGGTGDGTWDGAGGSFD